VEENTVQKNHFNFGFLLLIFLSVVSVFVGGMFFQKIVLGETLVPVVPTPALLPTPTLQEFPDSDLAEPQPGSEFAEGKSYFDDTVMMITEERPRRILVATVTRNNQSGEWVENVRASYFDGSVWTRRLASGLATGAEIYSNSLIKRWVVNVDKSRVLKQSASGEIKIDSNLISFETGNLFNEIGMRSLPGYSKFMSTGKGSITINNKKLAAKVLYTRIYSLNSSEIQFYSSPLGLTTDWVAFWDEKGNFYHVDRTEVDKPTPIYETHQIGVQVTKTGFVGKSFGVLVTRDTMIPPEKYSVSLQNPLNTILNFKRVNLIDKAPNSEYDWYMGEIEGEVISSDEKTQGFGIVEYIHD